MWFRLKRADYERHKGAGNRRAMRRLINAGRVPGILAYAGGRPVGWCSVAPREEFSYLGRSRILKPIDDAPVWSIVCLFVEKGHRNQGLSVGLLRAAIDYVKRQGGHTIEGYPVEPRKDRVPDVFAATGLASAYTQAGFTEVARRSETRPIMRYSIRK